MFSPTQSLTFENSRSFGAMCGPPSQPHPAINDAGPAANPSRRRSRRDSRGLVMTREPPTVPARDHGAQGRGVDEQHQADVHQGEGDEHEDRPEVTVGGGTVAAETPRQPG